LAAFAGHLAHTDADAVFVLGDLFELWVGDDARHEPFARRCVQALAAASARRALAVMVGNRDFLIGSELLAACGAAALPDPTLLEAFGQRVLLTHGDALCLADRAYQAFRRQVRDPAWLAAFLARPLVERLAFAREIRRASDTRRQFDGDMSADVDAEAAAALLRGARAGTLVHGHTHRPGSEAWPGGLARHVLSDWDLDGATRAEVLRLTREGFVRLPPRRAG
jgi:UDP-2,3-diacylglucosamine hydrolase